jgi:hypothetical protein
MIGAKDRDGGSEIVALDRLTDSAVVPKSPK